MDPLLIFGLFLVAVAALIIFGAAIVWGGARKLPPPPPPPEELPVYEQPRPEPSLPSPPPKRFQRRALLTEAREPHGEGPKNIRLRRMRKREVRLNFNAICRLTGRPMSECDCQSCCELRTKHGA